MVSAWKEGPFVAPEGKLRAKLRVAFAVNTRRFIVLNLPPLFSIGCFQRRLKQ